VAMFEESVVEVELPNGEKTQLDEGEAFRQTETPGVYIARDGEGKVVKAFAVNLDSKESDFEQFTPEELSTVILGTRSRKGIAEYQASFGPRREIWTYLLIALLVLLIAEVWLGNHTPA